MSNVDVDVEKMEAFIHCCWELNCQNNVEGTIWQHLERCTYHMPPGMLPRVAFVHITTGQGFMKNYSSTVHNSTKVKGRKKKPKETTQIFVAGILKMHL